MRLQWSYKSRARRARWREGARPATPLTVATICYTVAIVRGGRDVNDARRGGRPRGEEPIQRAAAQVNELGSTLVVLKNNKPWVTIHPADPEAASRRARLERFHSLTASIEQNVLHEPAWAADKSDRELLDEERMRRFG